MTVDDAIDRLGGEEGLRRLVDRFYDHMDQQPFAAPIRAMHARDLSESRRRLWLFLVGRFGGPQRYVEERGHPRLRMRHAPFAIGLPEAQQWMGCMDLALDECVADAEARELARGFLAQVAAHMINRG